ncbi:hypothetical protein G6F35_017971 [Rhizopus arrhizus]|nr:hypothetical protein G6F35_017971 [Rhizopus arrhizus]
MIGMPRLRRQPAGARRKGAGLQAAATARPQGAADQRAAALRPRGAVPPGHPAPVRQPVGHRAHAPAW